MERIRSILYAILVLMLFMLPGFWAANEAHGAPVDDVRLPQVEKAGHTHDGKYPLYVIHGDLSGYMWYNGKYSYTLDQLRQSGVGFIDRKDVNRAPYKCVAVCVDKAMNVVGINPNYYMSSVAAK